MQGGSLAATVTACILPYVRYKLESLQIPDGLPHFETAIYDPKLPFWRHKSKTTWYEHDNKL